MSREDVEYIKSHVGMDLSFQPEFQQQVAKTLLALLVIRKDENYPIKSLSTLSQLEDMLKRKSSRGIATLHEIQKAAQLFEEITYKEAEEVRIFLEGLLSSKGTLEQYMSREFGLVSADSFNSDKYKLDECRTVSVDLAMLNSGNEEDFSLEPQTPISTERIKEVITRYYTERGYAVEDDGFSLSAKKGDEEKIITLSNFGDTIMISVMNL